MKNIFVMSDPHFSHQGVCEFLSKDGQTKLRPWDNAEEMDEELVKRYNSVVGINDKCYFLGDIAIKKSGLSVLSRLNGDKVLIKGNHDIFKLKDYTTYFRDIRAYHVMDRVIMSHIPIHPSQKFRFRMNIHGHTHDHNIMKVENGVEVVDPWYKCVCVEQHDFTPVEYSTLISE